MASFRFSRTHGLVRMCGFAAAALLLYIRHAGCLGWMHHSDEVVKWKFTRQTPITSVSTFPQVYIPDNYTGIPCNYTLSLTPEKRLEKIASYEFGGIEKYTKEYYQYIVWRYTSDVSDLFPDTNDNILPHNPVFVTAFATNHFDEGLFMIYNFNKTVNKNKTFTLLVYDIGLTSENIIKVQLECGCQVRRFPFEHFPEHVSILKGYAWKPIIIQIVARYHPFVIWMDASIRFKTSNIEELLEMTREQGIVVARAWHPIAWHTSIETFRFLNEAPCLYSRTKEPSANFILLYHTPLIRQYLMKPWVSCALVKACMVTLVENVAEIINCNERQRYFYCHRFDQSILGILIYRLFDKNSANHFLESENDQYHRVCRGCKHE